MTQKISTTLTRRFRIVILCMAGVMCLIVFRASKTIFVEGKQWKGRIAELQKEDVILQPIRGNIYAHDGRLMASSIPRYKVFMDPHTSGLTSEILKEDLDALAETLSREIGERSPQGWKTHILNGLRGKSKYYRLIKRTVSYTERAEIQKYPLFKRGKYTSGLIFEEVAQREKPFGELASRTVGDVYGDLGMGGKSGLELAYDSLLRGTTGHGIKQNIAGRFVTIRTKEPQDGVDITSTIDIDIQDITYNALKEKLQEIKADNGCAIVMETKTGKIKAISNLGLNSNGTYSEVRNYAFSDISEPGSTFKVASMMVALEKGIVRPSDSIETGNGVYMYSGARMTDHNWSKGGYGTITAAQSIWYSSNIGVAKIILKGFEDNPSEYVDAIYKTGITNTFDIPIPGAAKPIIKHPKDTATYWSKVSLPWMSFGYETQIPPIYTLNFYNAIANDGKMMKPYLIENIKKGTKLLSSNKPEVLQRSICSRSTLGEIRAMLGDVVSLGTANMIHSDKVKLAGKTGTALISQGKSGYKAGGRSYQVSFCGYFPADDPEYSCIVVIRNPRIGYPSGGGMSGMVFKNIAERTYAKSTTNDNIEMDSTNTYIPEVKNGNYEHIVTALDKLDIDSYFSNEDWTWSTAHNSDDGIELAQLEMTDNLTPSVYGMGANDAVYLLESKGLRVQLYGSGRVYSQSKPRGSRYHKGETIQIRLK